MGFLKRATLTPMLALLVAAGVAVAQESGAEKPKQPKKVVKVQVAVDEESEKEDAAAPKVLEGIEREIEEAVRRGVDAEEPGRLEEAIRRAMRAALGAGQGQGKGKGKGKAKARARAKAAVKVPGAPREIRIIELAGPDGKRRVMRTVRGSGAAGGGWGFGDDQTISTKVCFDKDDQAELLDTDRVRLQGGEELRGEVFSASTDGGEGFVGLRHDALGELKVPLRKIEVVRFRDQKDKEADEDQPATKGSSARVALCDGGVVAGTVAEADGARVVVNTELGSLEIPSAWVRTVVFDEAREETNDHDRFRVRLRNGDRISGRLQSLKEGTLRFETTYGEEPLTLEASQVGAVAFPLAKPPGVNEGPWFVLRDGTQVRASQGSLAGDRFELKTPWGGSLAGPRSALKSLGRKPPAEKLRQTYSRFLSGTSDVISLAGRKLERCDAETDCETQCEEGGADFDVRIQDNGGVVIEKTAVVGPDPTVAVPPRPSDPADPDGQQPHRVVGVPGMKIMKRVTRTTDSDSECKEEKRIVAVAKLGGSLASEPSHFVFEGGTGDVVSVFPDFTTVSRNVPMRSRRKDADVLDLADGDRFSGSLESVTPDEVVFRASYGRIRAPRGEVSGVAFRIPPRAFLGIQGTNAAGEGALVTKVHEGSAAAAAGLKVGDVICKVAEETVRSMRELARIIRSYKPGDTVRISVRRDGADIALDAKLGDAGH
ncbi:S1C family serine protease [Planctomycetota bacterium]